MLYAGSGNSSAAAAAAAKTTPFRKLKGEMGGEWSDPANMDMVQIPTALPRRGNFGYADPRGVASILRRGAPVIYYMDRFMAAIPTALPRRGNFVDFFAFFMLGCRIGVGKKGIMCHKKMSRIPAHGADPNGVTSKG